MSDLKLESGAKPGGPAAVIGSQGNIPLGNWEGCRDDDLKPEYSP